MTHQAKADYFFFFLKLGLFVFIHGWNVIREADFADWKSLIGTTSDQSSLDRKWAFQSDCLISLKKVPSDLYNPWGKTACCFLSAVFMVDQCLFSLFGYASAEKFGQPIWKSLSAASFLPDWDLVNAGWLPCDLLCKILLHCKIFRGSCHFILHPHHHDTF